MGAQANDRGVGTRQKRKRSAKAPVMSNGLMAANSIWNLQRPRWVGGIIGRARGLAQPAAPQATRSALMLLCTVLRPCIGCAAMLRCYAAPACCHAAYPATCSGVSGACATEGWGALQHETTSLRREACAPGVLCMVGHSVPTTTSRTLHTCTRHHTGRLARRALAGPRIPAAVGKALGLAHMAKAAAGMVGAKLLH